VLGGAASAADLAVGAPDRALVPVWSWSGFYVGINGGYSVGTDDFTQAIATPSVLAISMVTTHTIAPKGGFFGLQGGFNWQTGPIVWGVEGDWQWASQSATVCGALVCLVAAGPLPATVDISQVYQKVSGSASRAVASVMPWRVP
jgi:outer membrane immunogenic protein